MNDQTVPDLIASLRAGCPRSNQCMCAARVEAAAEANVPEADILAMYGGPRLMTTTIMIGVHATISISRGHSTEVMPVAAALAQSLMRKAAETQTSARADWPVIRTEATVQPDGRFADMQAFFASIQDGFFGNLTDHADDGVPAT